MKALGPYFSTLIFALPALVMAAPARAGSISCKANSPGAPSQSSAPTTYPTFCSIPKAPTDIRPPAAFKAAVLDTRRSGVALVRATGPGTFELPQFGADAFARDARAKAAPPARPH